MKQRIVVLLLFLFLVLAPIFVFGVEDPELGTTTSAETDGEYITYEEFLTDPLVETYELLSPVDQIQHYAETTNVGLDPEIDALYFGNENHMGQNPEADERFFTGVYADDPEAQSRENFQTYSGAAERFITQTYTLSFDISFTNLATDFAYNGEEGTLRNSGKTITISEFQSDNAITSVDAVMNGFTISRQGGEKENTIEITGEQENTIYYDADLGSIAFGDGEGIQHNIDLTDEDVSLDFGANGKITIVGKATGYLTVNGQYLEFTNHVSGEPLIIEEDGDIYAVNAKVITPTLFADGQFQKEGNTITAWAHGNTKDGKQLSTYGNTDQSETIIIDRTTNVGIKTQGQNEPNAITIHVDHNIDNFPSFSKFKGSAAEGTTSATRSGEEILAEASFAQAAAAEPNLGKSAEVWIGNTEEGELVVTAKGMAEVFFSTVGQGTASIRASEPHFTGKSGTSEFDIKMHGEKDDINVRGLAAYSDSEYIGETSQNGASLRIQRPIAQNTDAILFACADCEAGAAVKLNKKILFAEKAHDEYDLYRDIEDGIVGLIGHVQSDGTIIPSIATEQLGALAAMQKEGTTAHIGRDFVIKTDCGDNIECTMQPQVLENGAIQIQAMAVDVSDQANPQPLKEIFTPLNIQQFTGEKIIIASEQEIAETEAVMQLLETGNLDELLASDITINNPEIEELIFEETGFALWERDNTEYVDAIRIAVERREEYDTYREQIEETYSIVLDDAGACIDGPCEKISEAFAKQHNLAWKWSGARIKVLQEKNAIITAHQEAGLLAPDDARALLNANNMNIAELADTMTQMDANVEAKAAQGRRVAIASGNDFVDGQGIAGRDSQDDKRRAHATGEQIIALEQRNKEIETSITFFEEEMDSFWVSSQAKAQYEEQIEILQAEMENNKQAIAQEEASITRRAEVYADRPDIAAEMCVAAYAECAGTHIATTMAYDEDRALGIAVSVALQVGDIASAKEYEQQIFDQTKAEIAQDAINKATLDQFGEEQEESRELARAKQEELIEEENSVGDVLADVDKRASLFNIVSHLTTGEGLAERYDEQEEQALGQLQRERHATNYVRDLVGEYVEQGMDVDEAMGMVNEGYLPGGIRITRESVGEDYFDAWQQGIGTTWFRTTQKEASGQALSTEEEAQREKEHVDSLIAFHEGKTAPVKAELTALRDNHPGTDTAVWAAEQLVALDRLCGFVTCETMQTYGELSEEIIGVTEVVPVYGIFSTATKGYKALRATKAGTKAASYASTAVDVTIGAERAASLSDSLSTIKTIATKDRYISYEGRMMQNEVEYARLEYDAAIQSGDAARIADAGRYLDDTETALQGRDLAKQTATSTLGRAFTEDIAVTKEAKEALKKQRTAVQAYDDVVKTEGAGSARAIAAADDVITTSARYKEVTDGAVIAQRLRSALSSTPLDEGTDTFKAVDELEEAGAVLVIEEPAVGPKKIGIDVSDVPVEQQDEVRETFNDIRLALEDDTQAHLLDEGDVIDEAEQAIKEATDAANTWTGEDVGSTWADGIVVELRAQSQGEGNGVLLDVDRAKTTKLGEVNTIDTLGEEHAFADLAEKTPSHAYMKEFGESTGVNDIDELLIRRMEALERTDLVNVRQVDAEILHGGAIKGMGDVDVGGEWLSPQTAEALRNDGAYQVLVNGRTPAGTYDSATLGTVRRTQEPMPASLQGKERVYVVYDETGQVSWKQTEAGYRMGLRTYTTVYGDELIVRTDDVMETMFDFCKSLGVSCGVTGSDAYRSIRRRIPTNIEAGSDIDVIAPSDAELAAIGYKEVGVDGDSWYDAAVTLQKDYQIEVLSDKTFTRRQIQWLVDLRREYAKVGIENVYLDLLGSDKMMRGHYEFMQGISSRKLIVYSDGKIYGSTENLNDALAGRIRLIRQPDAISHPLRVIRFVTEEKGIELDDDVISMAMDAVDDFFIHGTAQIYHPDYGVTTRSALIESFGETQGEIEFSRALFQDDFLKPFAKIFVNTQDPERALDMMYEIGLAQELAARGVDVDGIAFMTRDAISKGVPVSVDDIKTITKEKLQVGELPYRMTTRSDLWDLADARGVDRDAFLDVLGDGVSRNLVESFNGEGIKAKLEIRERLVEIAEQLRTPAGQLDRSDALFPVSGLYRQLDLLDETGAVKPEFAQRRLIDIWQEQRQVEELGHGRQVPVEEIREVVMPERKGIQIKEVIQEDGGFVMRTEENLYFVADDGRIYSVVGRNVDGEFRLLPGQDVTEALDSTTAAKLKITRGRAHLGQQEVRRVNDREERVIHLVEAAKDRGISAHSGNAELDDVMVNIHGSHEGFKRSYTDVTFGNPILERLHRQFDKRGVPVSLETDTIGAMDYRAAAAYDTDAGAFIYRRFTSEEEVVEYARWKYYDGEDFGGARRYLAEGQIRSLAGHETYHHAYRRYMTGEERIQWQEWFYDAASQQGTHGDAMRNFNLDLMGAGYEDTLVPEEFLTYRMHYLTFGTAERRSVAFPPSEEEIDMFIELGLLPEDYVPPQSITEGALAAK
jgi:hypothetical protein